MFLQTVKQHLNYIKSQNVTFTIKLLHSSTIKALCTILLFIVAAAYPMITQLLAYYVFLGKISF